MFDNKGIVSFAEFIQELQRELDFHKKGSKYRKLSAELCIQVANQVEKEFSLFLNRDSVKQMVSQLNVDSDRKNDVEKMLYTIARDLHRKATLSDEAKQYIQEKRQNRKKLQFKSN